MKIMKKLIVLFAILVLVFTPTAIARMGMMVIGGQVAGGADSCGTSIGTYMFVWTGDHATDPNYACFDSDNAQKAGAESGTPLVTTEYIETDGNNERVEWVNASNDGFDDTQGTLCFSLRITDDDSSTEIDNSQIWEFYYDGDNHIYIHLPDIEETIKAEHEGGGNESSITSTSGSLAFLTNYRICYTWQTGADAGGKHDLSLVAEGNATSYQGEEVEDLDDFATDAGELIRGEEHGGKYIDKVRTWKVFIGSGYKDTDPWDSSSGY